MYLHCVLLGVSFCMIAFREELKLSSDTQSLTSASTVSLRFGIRIFLRTLFPLIFLFLCADRSHTLFGHHSVGLTDSRMLYLCSELLQPKHQFDFPVHDVIISFGGTTIYMEDWLTTYEAVQLSGYELDYIRKLVRAQKITGRKWGQSWQVSRKSLQEFIKNREKQGEKRGRKPKREQSEN